MFKVNKDTKMGRLSRVFIVNFEHTPRIVIAGWYYELEGSITRCKRLESTKTCYKSWQLFLKISLFTPKLVEHGQHMVTKAITLIITSFFIKNTATTLTGISIFDVSTQFPLYLIFF